MTLKAQQYTGKAQGPAGRKHGAHTKTRESAETDFPEALSFSFLFKR